MRTIALLTALFVGAPAMADDAALRIAVAQAQAEAEVAAAGPPIAQALVKPAPTAAATTSASTYVWTNDPSTPGQLNLWWDGTQVGAMNAAGDYFATRGRTWDDAPSEPPTLPDARLLLRVVRQARPPATGMPAAAENRRPFAASSEGSRTDVRVAVPLSSPSPAADPSPARTRTPARFVESRGFTTTSSGFVCRT